MKAFKNFAEEMESTLVRTIRELELTEGKATSHPYHSLLTSYGYKHKGTDKIGNYGDVHTYEHPTSGHVTQVAGKEWWHGHGSPHLDSGKSRSTLRDTLKRIHD
jgi:hypothetical protein